MSLSFSSYFLLMLLISTFLMTLVLGGNDKTLALSSH